MFIQKKLETDQKVLLEVEKLSICFRQFQKGLRETSLHVIRSVDLTIYEGEVLAIVGASGSGKSLLANAILGLLPDNAILEGTIKYRGDKLTAQSINQLRGREISIIPQSVNSLDPLMKNGKQVQDAIGGKKKKQLQAELFHKVGLPAKASDCYPFELSGGMTRRVLVASGMGSPAKLLIADEPTPGLDPIVLSETVTHLKQLAAQGRGLMFITHDIETALQIADRIAIFYAGEIVEIAKAESFTAKGEKLRHPYTKALWRALPQNGFIPLPGSQPLFDEKLDGCRFAQQCSLATVNCNSEVPEAQKINNEMVRCFHA